MIGIGEAAQLKDKIVFQIRPGLFRKPLDILFALPPIRVLLEREVLDTDGQRVEQGIRVLDSDLKAGTICQQAYYLVVHPSAAFRTTYRSHDWHNASSEPLVENGHHLLNPSNENPAVRKVGNLSQHINT